MSVPEVTRTTSFCDFDSSLATCFPDYAIVWSLSCDGLKGIIINVSIVVGPCEDSIPIASSLFKFSSSQGNCGDICVEHPSDLHLQRPSCRFGVVILIG